MIIKKNFKKIWNEVKKAKNVTKEIWNGVTTLDLCCWIEAAQTSKDDDNPANSTFIKNFPCK